MKPIFLVLGIVSFESTAATTEYRVTQVDFPDSVTTAIYAINDLRHVVGSERDSAGLHHAFTGTAHDLRRIDFAALGSVRESWAYSINQRGDIAGYYTDANNTPHGYLRHAEGYFELVTYPNSVNSEAYGVNDWGNVIGVYNVDANGNGRAFFKRGGSYQPADVPGAQFTYPLSINDWNDIAGEYVTSANTAGFGYLRHENGAVRSYSAPGAAPEQTFFISINNEEQILGGYFDDAGNLHNFVKTLHTYKPFELPPELNSTYTVVQTLNDRGDVVGYYFDSEDAIHGFIAEKTY
jgi:uncharacterized membrane protein